MSQLKQNMVPTSALKQISDNARQLILYFHIFQPRFDCVTSAQIALPLHVFLDFGFGLSQDRVQVEKHMFRAVHALVHEISEMKGFLLLRRNETCSSEMNFTSATHLR